jgi:hypothetical protein
MNEVVIMKLNNYITTFECSKSKNTLCLYLCNLQHLLPLKVVVKWLRTYHMAMVGKIQISLLTLYECD